MSVTYAYDPVARIVRIIKGRDDHRPRRWTVQVWYHTLEGREGYQMTLHTKQPCLLPDLPKVIRQQIEEHAEALGQACQVYRWVATSR